MLDLINVLQIHKTQWTKIKLLIFLDMPSLKVLFHLLYLFISYINMLYSHLENLGFQKFIF